MISFPVIHRPKTFVSGLVALGLLTGALPAAAASVSQANDRPQVTVRYSALELSRTEGAAAALYRNLQRASGIVCGRYERDLTRWNMRHQCYEKTLRDAVQRVDHPTLAALYEARTLGSSIS